MPQMEKPISSKDTWLVISKIMKNLKTPAWYRESRKHTADSVLQQPNWMEFIDICHIHRHVVVPNGCNWVLIL